MSYRVATASERQTGRLLDNDETNRRLVQIRHGALVPVVDVNETQSFLEYSNKIRAQLSSNEKQDLNNATVSTISDLTMSPITFNTCKTFDNRVQVRNQQTAPRASPIQQNQTPWQRPNYRTLTQQQIISVLSKLPENLRKIELKFIENKALRETMSFADRIAGRRRLISSISGMMESTPRRTSSRPDVGRRRRRRRQTPQPTQRPILGRSVRTSNIGVRTRIAQPNSSSSSSSG